MSYSCDDFSLSKHLYQCLKANGMKAMKGKTTYHSQKQRVNAEISNDQVLIEKRI